jgi:hypothetical protein
MRGPWVRPHQVRMLLADWMGRFSNAVITRNVIGYPMRLPEAAHAIRTQSCHVTYQAVFL